MVSENVREPVALGMSGGRACEKLLNLRFRRPDDRAPVQAWVGWLEKQADLWDVILAADGFLANNARFMTEFLRGKIKHLRDNFKPGDHWAEPWTW